MAIDVARLNPAEVKKRYDQMPAQLPEDLRLKNAQVETILRPIAQERYSAHSAMRGFVERVQKWSEDYGGPLDMNPDFQRGHVWTEEQQKHFILNMLRGAIPESGFVIQFNCPNWENFDYRGELPSGFQCIDGLQRVTAVSRFLNDELEVGGLVASDLNGSSYSLARSSHRFIMQIYAFESKADLLEHYLSINTGGTPHSEAEIRRVQNMLKGLTSAPSI